MHATSKKNKVGLGISISYNGDLCEIEGGDNIYLSCVWNLRSKIVQYIGRKRSHIVQLRDDFLELCEIRAMKLLIYKKKMSAIIGWLGGLNLKEEGIMIRDTILGGSWSVTSF